MKKHYLAFVALAAAAVATSCSTDELAQQQEQNQTEPQTVTLTASVDGNNDVTRVGMTKDGSSAKFYWHEGDKIFVQTVNNETYGGAEFTTTGTATGATSATFTGEVTGTIGQYAVYPYNENHKFELDESTQHTKLTYNLPAEYDDYTPESNIFSSGSTYPANSTNMPMLGTIDNGKISFKPIGGLVVIRINKMPAESGTITVTADQQLSGNFEMDLTRKDTQITTPFAENTTDNSVKFNFNGATKDKVGVFYLPLAAGNYDNVKITVAYGSSTLAIYYDGRLEVTRKSVTAIPINRNAYDIAAESNGVTIYYSFNNDKTALTVTNLYANAENYSGTVVIPKSVAYGGTAYPVTAIGDEAFYDCFNLTSVTIPDGVTSIGEGAFDGCSSLTSIEIPNSVTSIGDGAFYGCSGLTEVKIPDGVTSIGMMAFYDCGLTEVKIPNNVTSIEYGAFYCCSSLTSIEIPNSVTSIGDYAFGCCSGLTSVKIGSGVKTIGSQAFTQPNPKIKTLYVYATTPPTIDDNTFTGTYSAKTETEVYKIALYVPAGSVDTYKAATNWKDFASISSITEN